MKAHGKYIKAINLKIDGRLSTGEDKRLMVHLENCDACRAEYEALFEIRRRMLTVADIPIDPEKADFRTSKIMAAVREKASTKVKPKRPALKPALGMASVIIILLASMAVINRPAPSGKGLFTNPDDIEFDAVLVGLLDEHEHLMVLEMFTDPLIIANEKNVNSSLTSEVTK